MLQRALSQMNGVLPGAVGAPAKEMETPSWFIADSSCNTVESQRTEQKLTEQLRELQQMRALCPLAHLLCPPTCPTARP